MGLAHRPNHMAAQRPVSHDGQDPTSRDSGAGWSPEEDRWHKKAWLERRGGQGRYIDRFQIASPTTRWNGIWGGCDGTRLSVCIAVVAAILTAPVSARPAQGVIVLPGATSAEGIAGGRGSSFFAGDRFASDIFTGDLQSGSVSVLRDAPEGRMAVGVSVDERHNLLFVAGGPTDQGYVYNTETGQDVAIYSFGRSTCWHLRQRRCDHKGISVVYRKSATNPASRANSGGWLARDYDPFSSQWPRSRHLGGVQSQRHCRDPRR
jgi:hypothetical protein